MFNILHEWLTCKLGTHYCQNLNFNNIGERFKDGFLFALLFQKYQVIPEKYVHVFKKTNNYDICLSNMKNINLWLQFMEIIIEDRAICEISHGQSLAVTQLLYKLYFKLEMSKECQIINTIDVEKNQKLNNNIIVNLCKSNGSFLSHQKEIKNKERLNAIHEKCCHVSKLFLNSNSISYTAIDVLKSINCINTCKGNGLKILEHNMNSIYDLFIMSLNKKKNEFLEKSTEKSKEILCRSTLLNILNIAEENNIITDNNFTVAKLDDENFIQNIDLVSQEDIKNESSTISSLKIKESIITQGLEEFKNEDFVKQDVFNEYLQHTGSWSSEYLNVDSFKFKQNILSMIIKEVLNFEYGISEIKFIKINNTNVAGVVDVIQNTKVIKLMKDNLRNKGILGFTAEDALSACLNAYNEEMKISMNKSILYQVVEEYENPSENASITTENSKGKKLENYSDYNRSEVKKRTENDSINSLSDTITSESNGSAESIYTTNKKLINKLIQTPENIPEPDYNNPVLSSMANLGKIIDEKQKKNHDLQIGDQINCIGEYIKLNQGINGWILLQFPVQPLQMALLEFMLTGKMPYFGKEIIEKSKKKSSIVPEYQDSEDMYTVTNTYLTNCIKIINHIDEMYSEKLNDFLQFYNQQNSIQIQISNLDNIIKEPKKAADILVGLILNEENVKTPSIFFKPINIFNNYDDDSIKSENYEKQISTPVSITSGDKTETIKPYEIANKFQILSTDLGRHEGNLTNYTFTALYLCDIWKTMEHNYTHKIKELLNNKDNFFNEVRISKELSITSIYQTIKSQNSSIMNLINKYENKIQNLSTDNHGNLKQYISELQTNLWDEVDNELEQVTQFINDTIYEQWVLKNNTLISTYSQLLETEMKRTITTLNFLNRYYVDNNETKTDEFEFYTVIINNNDDIDKFQIHCLETISKFQKYVNDNYEVVDGIDKGSWTVSVQTETNRLINQIYRLKASLLLDIKYFKDLTNIDHHLEKIHTIYQFKINDVNKLCEILECVEKNTDVRIEHISGQFFINKLSVFVIICRQVFHSKNKFNMAQLRPIVNKLLDYAPTFKIEINNFIDTLNKLCEIYHIYPKKWPIDNQFYNHFYKELFGSNITTIDWRDFVVQCMELPYPTIEQLLFYRKLFQDYDIGNETITIESYEATKLWFENNTNQHNDAKWLLYDMYQVQDGLNYSVMLLAFCRDEKPYIGLGKSLSLVFGWNPLDLKIQHTIQSYDEESENHIEYVNTVNNEIYPSESSYEEFIFDQDIMTWFLLKIFKLYMDSKDHIIGNINIPKIVKSIFLNNQTQQVMPTVIDLLKNSMMDNLYSTVYKFQAKELSEIAKNVALKYYDLSSLI
ncbi:uncharacterized protein LOC111031462 [Myzus persicae]|uniref:uncharacterized protein LOC111031462 n=1 Tax=Myzus persicae TaxID=13164 RepID=UPI000B934F50|nr:uncharacterized protein LOC111031462 [Myzus persicae]